MHKGFQYYHGQRLYMIELITKQLKIDCIKCKGVGNDTFQQPCSRCGGDGHTLVPVSLFELVGMVQILGTKAVRGEEAVSYTVSYFQLYHVTEGERAELSKHAWKSYDEGPDVVFDRRHHKTEVAQSELYVRPSTALDEAHDFNIALLGDINHSTKLDLIDQFHKTTMAPDNTPLVDAIVNAHNDAYGHDVPQLMGEYPALSYGSKAVTKVEFEKVLGPVSVEQALE